MAKRIKNTQPVETNLHLAAEQADIKQIVSCLGAGDDPNQLNPFGFNSLQLVATSQVSSADRVVQAMKLFVEAGVELETASRDGDLSSWYRCGIEKCKAISDIELASEEAQGPIKALADLGHTKEALKYVRAFLKRLPRTDEYSVEILRMAELGALICMMDDDSAGREKFLTIATKCDALVKRECDLNWASQSVREFRINQGLLDPADANDKERLDATFNFSKRILRER